LIENALRQATAEAVKSLYGKNTDSDQITVNLTRKEFEGDYSVVVFPFTRFSRKSPEETAREIGQYLQEHLQGLDSFNVVKGFVNCTIADEEWAEVLKQSAVQQPPGQLPSNNQVAVVEFCGPNTNKPLHLGHIRNMVIGSSVSNILEAAGFDVHRVNIYNDRGIAICKSMVAWLRSGNGKTPESTGIKGDHFIGEYYVEYDRIFRQEVHELMASGMPEEEAREKAPIYLEAQDMLRKWEANDPETLELWKQMNSWVYEGFEETYRKLGIVFEKAYYESEHYLSGKKLVEEGLEKGVFYRKEDGSVWVDLSDMGLDEKILLRKDGTSVYLTQDLGTAQARYEDFHMDRSIYVVADEQNYHFQVLKGTLQKLGKPFADGIYHLSYGMVDLPSGKMKSREGTTVDADDLIAAMEDTAREHTLALGKIEGFSEEEARALYHILGLGALKYYLLRVNPKKRILFNPEESIEFHGDTGPFIQYTYARIRSVLRKATAQGIGNRWPENRVPLTKEEKDIIRHLDRFEEAIRESADLYDPSALAQWTLNLAKGYNRFYQERSILNAEKESIRDFRLMLSSTTARYIERAMQLLGIEVPERM